MKEIHLPYIDYKYRGVLNFLTDNGITKIFSMFVQSGTQSRFSFYQANRFTAHAIRSKNGRWEWVITNLLDKAYFDKALETLRGCGIVFEEHPTSDPLEELIVVGGDKIDVPESTPERKRSNRQNEKLTFYAVSDRNICSNTNALQIIERSIPTFSCTSITDKLKVANHNIPDIVKDFEKNDGYAKNEYGMLMLSKRRAEAKTIALFFKNQNIAWWRNNYEDNHLTSCLYTGDMCMNKDADLGILLSLVLYNNEPLQFFQIPHHGSAHNSSLTRLQDIDTQLYFCYDNNCRRLVNNFGNALPPHTPYFYPLKILLIDRDSEMDEAVSIG